MNTTTIRRNDKFICCWGYDQTQYSVYNVVDVKGKFVTVEGLNSWSTFSASDLAAGSKIKVFTYRPWIDLSDEEQVDWESRGFDHWGYNRHVQNEAEEIAPIRTIVKVNRINGQSWSYLWVLDDGQTISSEGKNYHRIIKIVDGLKRCRVTEGYNGNPNIKIDEVIRAHHDPDYDKNEQRYSEQNEYTAYNGR